MKKLSETLTELGIDFSFPIEIKDANGKLTYCENSNDFWHRYDRDANGNVIYYESNGFWRRCVYDGNDRVTHSEDSDDFWQRWERDDKGRPTYHEDSNDFWQKWKRDANGDVDYYEDSTGVKKGTPKSDKAFIALDTPSGNISPKNPIGIPVL